MRKALRALALVTLVCCAVPLVAAPALAQFREFWGRVDKVKKGKKARLFVDNRMGDKVSFVKAEGVEVSGQGKTEWDQLEKGDYVTVLWNISDKPHRKAHRVEVRPAPKDAAVDE